MHTCTGTSGVTLIAPARVHSWHYNPIFREQFKKVISIFETRIKLRCNEEVKKKENARSVQTLDPDHHVKSASRVHEKCRTIWKAKGIWEFNRLRYHQWGLLIVRNEFIRYSEPSVMGDCFTLIVWNCMFLTKRFFALLSQVFALTRFLTKI